MTAPALRSASFLAASSGSAAKSGSSDSSTGVTGVRTVKFTPAAVSKLAAARAVGSENHLESWAPGGGLLGHGLAHFSAATFAATSSLS